jgi:hypothetical protein
MNLHPETAKRLSEIDRRHKSWAVRSRNARRIGAANVAAHDRAWLLMLLDELLPDDGAMMDTPHTDDERFNLLRAMHELTRAALREQGPLSVPGIHVCQERQLLEVQHTFPGQPVVTAEGKMLLARLVDVFEAKS